MHPALRHTPLAIALALIGQCATAEELRIAPTVVITGTRVEQNSFDLPMAIDSIDKNTIQEQRGTVNLSEVINRVPGVVSAGKETYSQEQSLTIRGFGARSQFGVRGIKLIADGIPASTPDGQGGTGLFDLASASRIEVLRGPFSALYGNHSGGVVQVFTEDGPERFTITPSFQAGSYGTTRYGLKFGDTIGNFNYSASVSRFDTDGFRDYSNASKEQANFKARWQLNSGTTLTVVGNHLNQSSQDPLGLTATQMDSDRRQEGTSNRSGGQSAQSSSFFGTRRSLDNTQGGAVLETALTERDTLRAYVYLGNRSNSQYLAINAAAQNNVTSAGALSEFDRDFWGTGVRWTRKYERITFSTGAEYERAEEDRRGFRSGRTAANDVGAAIGYGNRGALKRDEVNTARQTGVYGQIEWAATDTWLFSGGLRYTRVNFDSSDRFICNGGCSGTTVVAGVNPDDSGSAHFSDWTPVAGVLWKLTPALNLYANAGKSFEAPTLIELGYRNVGTGLNFDLKPSTSRQYEIGAKAAIGNNTLLNAAVFMINSADEIVTDVNVNGRTTYRNAGDTKRRGFELSADSVLGNGFRAYGALTLLSAKFDDRFVATGGGIVDDDNRIPGVAARTLYGEVSWAHAGSGFLGAIEGQMSSDIQVNDINSASAGGYSVMNLRAGLTQKSGNWRFNEFLRLNNLFDREYVGSVYLNDANGRFFAPAAERNWLIGVSVAYTL